jgi:hypothetical protein
LCCELWVGTNDFNTKRNFLAWNGMDNFPECSLKERCLLVFHLPVTVYQVLMNWYIQCVIAEVLALTWNIPKHQIVMAEKTAFIWTAGGLGRRPSHFILNCLVSNWKLIFTRHEFNSNNIWWENWVSKLNSRLMKISQKSPKKLCTRKMLYIV